MRGNILGFDAVSNSGALSGQDGRRYDFVAIDWHSARAPARGDVVDFAIDGQRATQVYLLESEYLQPLWSEFLFSFRGRISRFQYWVKFFLPYLAVLIVATILDVVIGTRSRNGVGLLSTVVALVAIWPGLAVAVKRCHDRGRSGWFLLVSFIPVVGSLWVLIELGFLRGTIGANRFGPDPVATV